MKIRTLFLLIILIAIAAFTALNWPQFIAPTTLSLGTATVVAPLGLIMLGLLVMLTVVFLAIMLSVQGTALMDTRRYAREMKAQRELADQAEASRFTELRLFVQEALQKQLAFNSDVRDAILARLELLDRDLRIAFDESSNGLSAHLGQLEDRLDHDTAVLRQRP